jgi:hypothetical protein
MRRANLWVAVCILIFGLIVLFAANRLGWHYDKTSGPGPGFLPFYLGLITVFGSAVTIWKAIKSLKEGLGKRLIPEGGLTPILWVLIPSTVMVSIIPIFGLHIAAMIFIIFYMRAVGKIEWYKCFLVGLLFPISLYIVFDRLFLIPLPSGIVGDAILPYIQ